MQRVDRLEGEDDFAAASTYSRPNTKAKEGGSLYVENTDVAPGSAIRMDDVEVYFRETTYTETVNRTVNKLMARIKCLQYQKRFEVLDESVEKFNEVKSKSL